MGLHQAHYTLLLYRITMSVRRENLGDRVADLVSDRLCEWPGE